MIISSLALKSFVVFIAGGTLISSIAIPTTIALNSASWPVLNGFPETHKAKYRDTCQLLMQAEKAEGNQKKYLFVCKENDYFPELFYYEERKEPISVTSLKNKREVVREKLYEVTVVLADRSSLHGSEITLRAAPLTWQKIPEKGIGDCQLKNNENKNKAWTLHCPSSDSGNNVDILLSPIIIY